MRGRVVMNAVVVVTLGGGANGVGAGDAIGAGATGSAGNAVVTVGNTTGAGVIVTPGFIIEPLLPRYTTPFCFSPGTDSDTATVLPFLNFSFCCARDGY
jgi:hypothetical protein